MIKQVLRKIRNIFSIVLLVLLVLLVVYITAQRFLGHAPTLFGYQVLRVSSGSMEPKLNIGDVILSKEVTAQELNTGDIITYKGTQGAVAGKLVTHAVTQAPYVGEDGLYRIQTQGISEGAPPDPLITQTQLVGRMVCVIPFINYLYNFFLTPWGLVVIILVILILFLGEFITLIKLISSRQKRVHSGLTEEQWQRILAQIKEEEEHKEKEQEKKENKGK